MFPVLISYFDLGVSYGLSDSVFPSEEIAGRDIGMVGLEPALGHGMVVSVPENVISTWRDEAARQAHRSVMETGRVGPRDVFDAELEGVVRTHVIERCTLTVYAIGIVFLDLRFAAGVDARFLAGLLACFEFAGYKPNVAQGLHRTAVRRIADALRDTPSMASPLTTLTSRHLPQITTDSAEHEPDGSDYEEQLLLRSFTNVLVCTEPGDLAVLPSAMQALDPDTEPKSRPVVKFEYHGQLQCGWATSAAVAKRIVTPENPGDDAPEDQVKRMLACLEIAHVFYGTCEAFERLFLGEIDEQVNAYLRRSAGGRQPDELNRLRNLALAVVSLTGFSRVTEAKEDQEYFAWFEVESQIQTKRGFIRDAADMLYNVSDAETQAARSRRELALNAIVLLLTSVTLLTVTSDAYNFVRDQAVLVGGRAERIRILAEFLLALGLLVAIATYLIARPHPIHRWRRKHPAAQWEPFDDPTRPPRPAPPA